MGMNGKVRGYATMLMAVVLLSLCGCSNFKKIRPVSAGIEEIQMQGLRSAALALAVEVDNPAAQISLSEIEGVKSVNIVSGVNI